MPMGPIELADMVGLDICWAVGQELAKPGNPIPKKLQAVVQWQYLNPGQKGNDGLYSILGGLNYYIHGDDLKLMVNYIHTWSDFRQANPEFGEDQFDEVIGRVQLMF